MKHLEHTIDAETSIGVKLQLHFETANTVKTKRSTPVYDHRFVSAEVRLSNGKTAVPVAKQTIQMVGKDAAPDSISAQLADFFKSPEQWGLGTIPEPDLAEQFNVARRMALRAALEAADDSLDISEAEALVASW